jgi:putative transposase
MVSNGEELTVKRQCELLEVNRSSFYYEPKQPTAEEKAREEHIKKRLDYWHTKHCWMGSRKLANKLKKEDKIEGIGRQLVRRYMREMGIFAVYPKPNLSKPSKEHKKYPYLLRKMNIWLPNQVWAIDITYIPMKQGHMYLTAIIDWYSRYIIGWELSDTLETAPVLEAVKNAINKYGTPAIINSDQGSQFTSDDYISLMKEHKIRQSMDGKARWIDNVIIERWFRSLKTEDIHITEYDSPRALRQGIREYIKEYNFERPHQSLGYKRPCEIYDSVFGGVEPAEAA